MSRLEGRALGGGSLNEAAVDSDSNLATRAVIELDFEHVSEHERQAYVATSTYNATGGQEIIYLQNTSSTLNLHIERVVCSTAATGIFTLFRVTSASAAGGGAITPLNLFLGSANAAAVNAFGDAEVTGGLSGTTIDAQDIPTVTPYDLELNGALILPQNEAVAITAEVSGIVFASIFFFFEEF